MLHPRLVPLAFLSLVSLALLVGCAASVPVGAYQLNKELWDSAQAEVKERASFELKCPKEQIQLTLLAAQYSSATSQNLAKQIGVDGCGHRLVYVVSRAGWILNSSDGEGKPEGR